MKTPLQIPIDKKIKAVYLLLIIHTMQVGVGIAGLPRFIFAEAKQDSWISLLLAGIIIHIVVAIIIFVLRTYPNTDLLGVLSYCFGNIFGKILGMIFTFYFFLVFLSILLNYVEFVQVFIFPRMPSWFISLLLISLVFYAVYSGLRVAVGTCIVFYFATFWIALLLIEPITMIEFDHYFPIFHASPTEILEGARITTYSLLGFELLWLIYPFIQDQRKIGRYAQGAVAITILYGLYVVIVSIGYFSADQLEEKIWPLLTMFKILSLPMFERFDILAVALWMMVILPNLIMFAWMISYSCKRVCGFKQKHSLVAFLLVALIISSIVQKRENVNAFTTFIGEIGFGFGILFPLLILPFAIFHRWKGKKQS
ncbi:GerAB/ArcD/ProY family transporter [Halalkalibacillus halophilus]|uniref:GerAB/ArcD/ProY family transporter n=1 Tax=Halalkalibacillus halophilus TaxID=392827 RepID=UPI0003FAEB25|nr:GerAB/ArcD/ProY family transporter [Halalkalibacillus halophilus]